MEPSDAARAVPPELVDVVLAAAPQPPRDPALFSSNVLFGEPGIYPDGPDMVPAAGDAPDEEQTAARLAAAGFDLELFADPALVAVAPDPGPRGGLVALAATFAAPLVDALRAGPGTPVTSVRSGPPASPGRIVGPPANGESADPGARVVNDRYRAEHPALCAGSLAHDLLWSGPGAGQCEEAFLHALCAMVHVVLVAAVPELAHTGTELARRQSSLAITLLNSRHPGSPRVSLDAPDGPGTIPGGAPSMQTPDFWSIPFVGGDAASTDDEVPTLLAQLLVGIAAPDAPAPPARYDQLAAWFDAHGRWIDPPAQLRAAFALGLVEPAVLAAASDTDERTAVEWFGLADVDAWFSR